MIARMGSATARAPIERLTSFKAPLFDQIFDQLEAERRWVLLELGAASTPLLDLLAGSRVLVEIANLDGCGGLDMLNAEPDEENLGHIAELVLPRHNKAEPVDIVFCWDLLNYMRKPAIRALAGAIEKRARRGTLLHGLVVYSDKDMPSTPARLIPEPDRRLRNLCPEDLDKIPAPRYSPEVLSQTMGNFAIERAMLLANGMQEFLFRL